VPVSFSSSSFAFATRSSPSPKVLVIHALPRLSIAMPLPLAPPVGNTSTLLGSLAGKRGNMKDVNRVMVDWLAAHHRGSVTMLRPDGTQAPSGSVFTADNGFWAPWGAAIDGDDHVWISELVGGNLIELCGSRTETCPPGMKTGDPISPKGGFVGGGVQWLTDVAVDPAGNVWVANNWQDYNVCFGMGTEAVLTHCGGNGLTVFYGLAKPVSAPQIGPARAF
jgi:hypothetical protein